MKDIRGAAIQIFTAFTSLAENSIRLVFICLLAAAPLAVYAKSPPQSDLYLKVQLNSQLKAAALEPGGILEGKLSQDVYAGDRKLFPAGSAVHLTVDKLERRRKLPNDHWPWMVRIFIPRHERYPTFKSASIHVDDGSEIPLQVSLISFGDKRDLWAGRLKAPRPDRINSIGKSAREKGGPVLALQSVVPSADVGVSVWSGALVSPAWDTVTMASQTQANVILMASLSAGKSHAGQLFQARLISPVLSGSGVLLPAGCILDGTVVHSIPPRWLSRAGSLYLSFNQVEFPGGSMPVAISIDQVEIDTSSRTRMDSEGKLSGGRPGKIWMLANLGATAGISKVADDTTQLLAEVLISTATDASTAGIARIIGACVSGAFMLARHGRDVVLPKYTEMIVTFDRSPVLNAVPPQSAPARKDSPNSGSPRFAP
jgi:hypothetical protein